MFNLGSALSVTPKAAKACRHLPLTPERIPSFIIPPKIHLRSPRAQLRQDTDRKQLLKSPESCAKTHLRRGLLSPSFSLPERSPRFFRLHASPLATLGHSPGRVSKDGADLSTRAAMGLEHVKKISTPFGFRTLAESPHVRRRESLFHGPDRCNRTQPPASPGTGSGRKDGHEAVPVPSIIEQPSSTSPSAVNHVKKSNPKAVLKSTKTSLQKLLRRKPRR